MDAELQQLTGKRRSKRWGVRCIRKQTSGFLDTSRSEMFDPVQAHCFCVSSYSRYLNILGSWPLNPKHGEVYTYFSLRKKDY